MTDADYNLGKVEGWLVAQQAPSVILTALQNLKGQTPLRYIPAKEVKIKVETAVYKDAPEKAAKSTPTGEKKEKRRYTMSQAAIEARKRGGAARRKYAEDSVSGN